MLGILLGLLLNNATGEHVPLLRDTPRPQSKTSVDAHKPPNNESTPPAPMQEDPRLSHAMNAARIEFAAAKDRDDQVCMLSILIIEIASTHDILDNRCRVTK